MASIDMIGKNLSVYCYVQGLASSWPHAALPAQIIISRFSISLLVTQCYEVSHSYIRQWS